MSNLTYLVHNFYIYALVDWFGIFYPQIGLTTIALCYGLWVRKDFLALADLDPKEWLVDDHLLLEAS